jgi:hypothetical protein
MRPFGIALLLAAALAMATAPITLADQPTSLDIFIPSDTKVCLGDRKLLATITERLERSVTGAQFSNGATVSITEFMVTPVEEAHISFVPVGPRTITLVDDWTSLPNGALSDGLKVKVWATGRRVGHAAVGDLGNVTFRTRELSPKPQTEDSIGVLYQFDVVRCAPRATLPPTDASASPSGPSEHPAATIAWPALLGFVLGLVAWRRRSMRGNR